MSGLDFQTIATSISTASTIAKGLIAADRAYDKAELKLKLADLMVALADARTSLAEMQDVTYRLADEADALKRKLAFAGTMRYEAPYYLNVADGKRDGPYCARCWDKEKAAIRLYEWNPHSWTCQVCKSAVVDDNGGRPHVA